MSDLLVRLKVNSSEWDSKLKNASEQLNRYMEGCRKAGGTLEILDEGVMDVVKSLGNMETKAQSTRGQLRELTEALTGLTASYRDLSDAERNSETGKAMEDAMSKLTQRAGNLKDAMGDVNRAISGQASDTRVFDQLSGGAQMVTASFQTLQGASKMLGFDIGNDVEVLAKLQAAMAVTTGLTQIQNAVQKESAVMQGVMAVQAKAAAAAQALQTSTVKGATVAQAAFNAVAKANPYVLLASAVAAVGTALFAFSGKAKEATAAIKTNTQAMDEAKRMADIWRNTMQGTFSSLMTKYDELKRQWLSLKDEHQKTEWIKKNQQALSGLGQSITDVKGAEDFFSQNTDAVVEAFVRRAQAAARVAQLTELYRKQIELLDKKQQTQDAIAKDAQAYGRSAQAGDEIKDSSYWNSRYGAINQRTGKWEFHEAGAKLYSGTDTSTAQSVQKIDVQIQANQQEIDKVKGHIENDFKDINVVIPTPSVNGSGSVSKETQNEIQKNEAAIAKLTEEYQKLATDAKTANDAQLSGIKERQTAIQTEIANLKTRNEELKKFASEAQGIQVNIGVNSSLPDLTAKLKELQAAQSQALNGIEWQEYQKQIEQVNLQIDAMKGKWKDGMKATFTLQAPQDLNIPAKTVEFKADNASVLEQLREVQGVIIDDKTLTVTANTSEAIAALQQVEGLNIQPKTVEFKADNTSVLEQLREVQGVIIDDKTLTVTANTAEAIAALQQVEGLTVQPKQVEFKADNAAVLEQLREVQGVTIDDKTLTVTANTAEAYNKVQDLLGTVEGASVRFAVEPNLQVGTNIQSDAGISAYINMMKQQLQTADYGSALYQGLSEQLSDTTTLQSLVQESLKVGLGTAMFDIADELGKDFWTRAMEGGVENIEWDAIAEQINDARKAAGLDKIDFNVGGNIAETGKETEASWKSAAAAVQNVGTALKSVEDPGAKIAGIIGQAIANIALGFAQASASSSKLGVFGWIAAVTGGLATMISTIAAIHSSTGYADGGIIKGNSYSGDNLKAIVDGGDMVGLNAGEIVLNKAQTGNLASALQERDGNPSSSKPYVTGDTIVLGVNNWARKHGKGELVFTRG